MQDIYEPTSDFVFDNIVLISPKNIKGGNTKNNQSSEINTEQLINNMIKL